MSKIAHSSIGIINVDDGAKGEQGYSVTGTFPEYYLSSSSTALVDGSWSETKPTATENKYIWTRLKTVLSNGTMKYSNSTCDTTLSGVISKVNQAEQKITNKVWQTDISASIDSYDSSKGKSIRDRVSKVETDLTGVTSTVSSVQTTLNSKANTSDVTNLTSKIQQNADKIGMMVSVNGTSSALTLTDKMLEAVTKQFVVKSPNGVSTIIEGGKIKTDALKSTNYQSGSVYSQQGSLFDLSNGNIITPNFAVKDGAASIKGTITSTSGTIGRWKIGTDTLTATDGTNQVGLGDSSRAFWAGSTTSTAAPFQVLYDGTVVATKLKIGDAAISDYVNNAADYANQKSLSRGNNLVTNGNGILGNNYNFPDFEYDGYTCYNGSCGSFKCTGNRAKRLLTEKIPVDKNKHYKISVNAKSSVLSAFYGGISCYDIDGYEIRATDVRHYKNSLTTLAQDLNDGDTVVHLTSTDGFNKKTDYSFEHGLIFWNYKNSYGYQYLEETYSRNHWSNLWSGESSFSGNDITLSSPWSHGHFDAGTKVSQISDSNGWMYFYVDYNLTDWISASANVDNLLNVTTVEYPTFGFRPGTAFIKIGFLTNYYNSENCTTWVTNVRLEEIDDTAIEAKDLADTANTTATTANKTANTAKSTADSATSTANTAKSTATDAKSLAQTANSTANTAKSTAETATSTANAAKDTANNASTVATAAKDNAAKAQKTADDATKVANTAKDLATKTSKYITTITDIDGITVHNADDLKNFTNMNSDGVSIYVDSNPVAKFGKDGIDLLSNDNSKLSITKSGIKAVTSSQTDYFNITLNQSSDKRIINEILPFDYYIENSTYIANFNLKYQLDNINSTQGVKIVGMTQDQDNLISATIQTTNQAISLDSTTAKSFADKKVSMVRISYVAYNPTANMTLGAKQTNGKYTFEIDSLGNIRTIGGIRVGWDGNNDITAVGNSDGLFALSVGIDNTAMRVGWDGTVYTDVINAGLSSGNLQIVTTGTEGHVDIDGRLYVSKDVVARTDSYNSVGLLDLSWSTLTLSSLKKPAIYNERLASVIGGYKQVGRIVFVHLVIHMDEAGFTESAVLTGLPIPASKNWGNADTPLTAMNISKKSPCYLFVNRYGSIVLTADPSNWIIVHGFYMAEQA